MKLTEIEINNDCEKSCGFVKFLSTSDEILARRARLAASGGKNTPGILGILCSNCTINKIIAASLEEKMIGIVAR